MACLHAAVRRRRRRSSGRRPVQRPSRADTYHGDAARVPGDWSPPARRAHLPHGQHRDPAQRSPGAGGVVRQGYRAGVDAFIVQDLGLAAEMRRTLPEADLTVSTQMNVVSTRPAWKRPLLRGLARRTFCPRARTRRSRRAVRPASANAVATPKSSATAPSASAIRASATCPRSWAAARPTAHVRPGPSPALRTA